VDGNPIGNEFLVNTYVEIIDPHPEVAMDAAGRFVIVWDSHGQDGDGSGIYGQRFDDDGNPIGNEFRINSYTIGEQYWPYMAMDTAGKFVVAWISDGQDGSDGGIYAKRFECISDEDCTSEDCIDGICGGMPPTTTTTTSTMTTTSTTTIPTTTTTTSSSSTTTTTIPGGDDASDDTSFDDDGNLTSDDDDSTGKKINADWPEGNVEGGCCGC
jgi:hypothetical protein